MICSGCGNSAAVVTRTWFHGDDKLEVCNAPACGNLRAPYVPDVYFRGPEFVENLGDEAHPFGQMVESPRHKARLLREQGLREDGDRVRGSREKGVHPRKFSLTPALAKKRDEAVTKAIVQFKKSRGASVSRPMKMVRRK